MKNHLYFILTSLFFTQTLFANADPHSYANYEDIKITHISLNLKADFEQKVLIGSVTLSLKSIHPVDFIQLDSRDLKIFSISGNCDNHWSVLTYQIAEKHKILGSKIKIQIQMDNLVSR